MGGVHFICIFQRSTSPLLKKAFNNFAFNNFYNKHITDIEQCAENLKAYITDSLFRYS